MDTVRTYRGVGIIAALAVLGIVAFGAPSGGGRAAAQADQPATPTSGPATVFVNGHGSVRLPPDTAMVTVGVDVLLPTLDAAQAEATAQATAIIDAVLAAGVADEDVQTSNYSVSVIRNYDDEGNPAEIQGFQISNQVNVTIRDVDAVGEILDAVVAAGANNIWGISFYVDDPTAAASQARVLAVEDARRKAEELAAAAGMTVGRIVSISEGFSPVPPPVIFAGGGAEMAMDRAAVPIEAGTSEVAVDVQMTFELEPAAS